MAIELPDGRCESNDVLDALNDMAQLLRTTGQNYQSTDDSSAGTVHESGAGL